MITGFGLAGSMIRNRRRGLTLAGYGGLSHPSGGGAEGLGGPFVWPREIANPALVTTAIHDHRPLRVGGSQLVLAIPGLVLARIAVQQDRGVAQLPKQLFDIRARGEDPPDFVGLALQFSEPSVQDVS